MKSALDTKESGPDFYVILFSITLFLSATLLFTAQPMVGKMMLPIIGGAPGGWLVTIAYFQMALLAGYFLAYLLTRLSVRIHMAAVCFLLACSLTMLPLHLQDKFVTSGASPKSLEVALMLAAALTLPVVSLASLSPSLQRLFSSGTSRRSHDPYFLFAASNLGSLGGLLLYPLWIERVSGLSKQTIYWEAGYVALLVFSIICVAFTRVPNSVRDDAAVKSSMPIAWSKRGFWVLMAFIPSSLMLGLTAQITQDTGSVPFFWIVPLTLYLLTFIRAFRAKAKHTYRFLSVLQIMGVISLPLVLHYNGFGYFGFKPFYLIAVFYITARLCHGVLAAQRPAYEFLTEYYLWIAVGGAMGGSFNAFLVPHLFTQPDEYLWVALLACAAHFGLSKSISPKIDQWFAWECAGFLAFFVGALGLFWLWLGVDPTTIAIKRNFFGVLRVIQVDVGDVGLRYLRHGTTLHGLEQVAPQIDTSPGTYYAASGPLGDLMNLLQPKSVGLIGLGTGNILCYQAPGRHFTVYEIDPDVVNIANTWFDYIRRCGKPEIRIGDGRKMMEADTAKFDLLVVDAFTSDSIPFHLLTKEAMQMYLGHLNENGIIAFHISNNFYNLRYPLSDLVDTMGLGALTKQVDGGSYTEWPIRYNSIWAVIARRPSTLLRLRTKEWTDLPVSSDPPWTDDFSNTLSALVFFHYNLLNKEPNDHAQTH